MHITISEFTEKILAAVRKEAKDQGITQGAIAIAFEGNADVMSLPIPCGMTTFTFPIIEGGDTVFRDDEGGELGDCAGVVAMKIAAAKRAITYHEAEHCIATAEESTSGALPEEFNGNGRINWKGCVAFPVGVLVGGHCGHLGMEAGRIYVSVSGGKQDQDEAAAWAALSVIAEALEAEYGCMLPRTFYERLHANSQ